MSPCHLANLPQICLAALVGVSGCSSQQLYGGGQAWQRNECQRIPDLQKRNRCMQSAALGYEEYRRQAAAGRASR